MRVGVISDIHANLPALNAVLDDMPDVDKLVCCGDIVGYGPQPQKCVSIVRNRCDMIVQGNHDRYVSNPSYYNNTGVKAALRHAQEQLDHPQIRWLRNLQKTQVLDNYVVTHSHPTIDEYRILSDDFESLSSHFTNQANGLIFGHTHYQNNVKVNDVHFVNPGSVGQPRDGNPKSCYAILDTEETECETFRVSYNVEKTIEEIRLADLPESLERRLE